MRRPAGPRGRGGRLPWRGGESHRRLHPAGLRRVSATRPGPWPELLPHFASRPRPMLWPPRGRTSPPRSTPGAPSRSSASARLATTIASTGCSTGRTARVRGCARFRPCSPLPIPPPPIRPSWPARALPCKAWGRSNSCSTARMRRR